MEKDTTNKNCYNIKQEIDCSEVDAANQKFELTLSKM
jgi:hypothetical protein